MKRYFSLYIAVAVLLAFAGCKKNESKPCCEVTPLYFQLGAAPKMYTKFTVTPETQDAMSADFKARWEIAKTELEKIDGRRLRSFEIRFIDADNLDIVYSYNPSTGGTAQGIITYTYSYDSNGYMKLTYAKRNTNGRIISPALFSIQEDYLERYSFLLNSIEDKIPGSTGKLAGLYKQGDNSSYIYGSLSK